MRFRQHLFRRYPTSAMRNRWLPLNFVYIFIKIEANKTIDIEIQRKKQQSYAV